MPFPLPQSLNVAPSATAVGGNSSIAPLSVTFPSLNQPASPKRSLLIGAGVAVVIFGAIKLLTK